MQIKTNGRSNIEISRKGHVRHVRRSPPRRPLLGRPVSSCSIVHVIQAAALFDGRLSKLQSLVVTCLSPRSIHNAERGAASRGQRNVSCLSQGRKGRRGKTFVILGLISTPLGVRFECRVASGRAGAIERPRFAQNPSRVRYRARTEAHDTRRCDGSRASGTLCGY